MAAQCRSVVVIPFSPLFLCCLCLLRRKQPNPNTSASAGLWAMSAAEVGAMAAAEVESNEADGIDLNERLHCRSGKGGSPAAPPSPENAT